MAIYPKDPFFFFVSPLQKSSGTFEYSNWWEPHGKIDYHYLLTVTTFLLGSGEGKIKYYEN